MQLLQDWKLQQRMAPSPVSIICTVQCWVMQMMPVILRPKKCRQDRSKIMNVLHLSNRVA